MLSYIERRIEISDMFLDLAERVEDQEASRWYLEMALREAHLAEEEAARDWWRSEILEEAES